jgi:hypothetical protein
VDEARRLASQMPNRNQQVSFYIQIYNHARQKNDEKLARRTLDEAAALVPANPESSNDMSATVQLANAYANIAPETALAMLEPTIVKVNELLGASILLNRFSYAESGSRADEITMQFFHNSLSQYGFYFNQQDCFKLAMGNFERTRNLADGFQRPEARIFLRLMMAQGILSQLGANGGNGGNVWITRSSRRSSG